MYVEQYHFWGIKNVFAFNSIDRSILNVEPFLEKLHRSAKRG
jgi:hypothetical protein